MPRKTVVLEKEKIRNIAKKGLEEAKHQEKKITHWVREGKKRWNEEARKVKR